MVLFLLISVRVADQVWAEKGNRKSLITCGKNARLGNQIGFAEAHGRGPFERWQKVRAVQQHSCARDNWTARMAWCINYDYY